MPIYRVESWTTNGCREPIGESLSVTIRLISTSHLVCTNPQDSTSTFLSEAVERLSVMSEFETFECQHCGESFKALPDANAGTKRYCSPACETEQLAVQ